MKTDTTNNERQARYNAKHSDLVKIQIPRATRDAINTRAKALGITPIMLISRCLLDTEPLCITPEPVTEPLCITPEQITEAHAINSLDPEPRNVLLLFLSGLNHSQVANTLRLKNKRASENRKALADKGMKAYYLQELL